MATDPNATHVGDEQELDGAERAGEGRGRVIAVDVEGRVRRRAGYRTRCRERGDHRHVASGQQAPKQAAIDRSHGADRPQRAVVEQLSAEQSGILPRQPDRRNAGGDECRDKALVRRPRERHPQEVDVLGRRDAPPPDEGRLDAGRPLQRGDRVAPPPCTMHSAPADAAHCVAIAEGSRGSSCTRPPSLMTRSARACAALMPGARPPRRARAAGSRSERPAPRPL